MKKDIILILLIFAYSSDVGCLNLAFNAVIFILCEVLSMNEKTEIEEKDILC